MVPLAPPGLTSLAVAGRGLSELLGHTAHLPLDTARSGAFLALLRTARDLAWLDLLGGSATTWSSNLDNPPDRTRAPSRSNREPTPELLG